MGMPISVHVRGPARRTDPRSPRPVDGGVRPSCARSTRCSAPTATTARSRRLRRGELTSPRADPRVREVAGAVRGGPPSAPGAGSTPGCRARTGSDFDPTGLVKGWAVEASPRHLAAGCAGPRHCVNAGGDVAVRCARDRRAALADRHRGPARPRPGSLAVRRAARRRASRRRAARRAARTSSTRTPAEPATGLPSATVIGPSLLWADVYATAAFARGRTPPAGWPPRAPDHDVLVVHRDPDA